MKRLIIILIAAMAYGAVLSADEKEIRMNMVDKQGLGNAIGSVTVRDSEHGLMLYPNLKNLPPGIHGFHVHENPDCGSMTAKGESSAATAAGGHYDPENTGRHEGPYGKGHLGDLPAIYADKEGNASLPLLAPRLKVSDLAGRALVIHAGGDNYSDVPEELGGGGARIACGVIE